MSDASHLSVLESQPSQVKDGDLIICGTDGFWDNLKLRVNDSASPQRRLDFQKASRPAEGELLRFVFLPAGFFAPAAIVACRVHVALPSYGGKRASIS